MGDPRGFLKVERSEEGEIGAADRVRNFDEFALPHSPEELRAQASRCMDCGIPFCHQGCPLSNLIPEFNHLVYRGAYAEAVARLLETNNFPEITGRVCPAPCEASCVLNIDGSPVTIKNIERSIARHGEEGGSFEPKPAASKTGFGVAIVGSGPAGLAAAQELARKGHDVTVFERDDRIGGLVRYGIPDFKLGKAVLDRRIDQMAKEGVRFETGVNVGVDCSLADLRAKYQALLLTLGARIPRDLPLEGRNLEGIHFAMDYLVEQNRRVASDAVPGGLGSSRGAAARPSTVTILATGKNVVVIGGGDTGSDCVGTAIRQGAKSVLQLELMPKPPLARMPENPWPEWPMVLRTSSSQKEGAERDWAVSTRKFVGQDGHVTELEAVRVHRKNGRFEAIEGSTFRIPCDLALLAMGFTGTEATGFGAIGLSLDDRGNLATDEHGATSVPGVFAAGDMSRGQSLVVWAIADGRRAARSIDGYLMSKTNS